jgi:TetR/AcrR family transcriptional regulator, transcriptional repressor of aconitase
MAITRLDSEERRKAIVRAAVPLFARTGFAGTTTRELADAAGISEALLFRHFPSKQQLYSEILRLGCEGDPALEKLADLPPSSAALGYMIRLMVRHFLQDRLHSAAAERGEFDSRLRLVLHSCLEDGDFARELFETVSERVIPLFAASLEAAIAAGDVAPSAASARNLFWFAHHVAAMMAFAGLPERNCIPYDGGTDTIVEAASTFILRGLGMSDAAIAAGAAIGFDPAAG